MKIKDIAIENRPRERLFLKGVSVLSDAEVIALVIGSGSAKVNAIDLANKLIVCFGFEKLNVLSLEDLQQIDGIGIAKAAAIVASFELARRVNGGRVYEKVVKNADDVGRYYVSKMKDYKKEHFVAVFLDSKNKIIKDEVVSVGTLDSSLVHPREVFKEAVRCSAASVILVHNHPSGDCSSSDEDVVVTLKLKEAGDALGIRVLDHLIVGKDGWRKV